MLDREELLARHARPREGRLVLTNGCFDLLHRGHVQYLEEARCLGDALVVGLNTDNSVRRLKGPGRPLVAEGDRSRILAGLASVDAVTLFDEDTPLELISLLLPDVLVKGGDYNVKDVVGSEVVEGAGGTVVVTRLISDYSTSALLERLRANE